MYGAILGDMIGAPYEFDRGNKTKDFTLFTGGSNFTDDTVMTIAVAEALLNAESKGEAEVKALIIESMQKWGRKYPNAGYGGRFIGWLWEADPKPYGSYGNGSAMRVAAAGWLYDTIERTREMARLTAETTRRASRAQRRQQARYSLPAPAAARKRSGAISSGSSDMTFPAPAMK